MEATLVGNGILFSPRDMVSRVATADRIAAMFAERQPASRYAGLHENEIMGGAIAEIAESRRERGGTT